MAIVKFISGDGVEHLVEEASVAAAHMVASGFQKVGEQSIESVESGEPGEEITYTLEDAIAQNNGLDEHELIEAELQARKSGESGESVKSTEPPAEAVKPKAPRSKAKVQRS